MFDLTGCVRLFVYFNAKYTLHILFKKPKYQRIILKLSGEALSNDSNNGPINKTVLNNICKQIKHIHDLGVSIGIVIGGGNIFRDFPEKKSMESNVLQETSWACLPQL